MAKKVRLIPVTMRALSQRINRRLSASGKMLVKCRRNSRHYLTTGEWVLVGASGIEKQKVDIAAMVRELQVLKHYETICD